MTAQELIAKVLELDAKATKGPYSTRGEWIEYQIGNTKGIGVIASAGISALKDKQKDINVECLAHYRTAAPILARMLQKAIEQRNDEGTWIQSGDPRERWKKYDAELDRIAKGEE